MKNLKTSIISFSPTGTTGKLVKAISEGMFPAETETHDLTKGDFESAPLMIHSENIAIIGVPVYAGRVAPTAKERLKKIKGNGTPAVMIVVYGNRAYEDALLELEEIISGNGFIPVAAGTFIGEHSFSTDETPIAPGRPDKEDIELAKTFGSMALEKISGKTGPEKLNLPGNRPFRDGIKESDMCPETIHEKCRLCGNCINICPVSAISIEKKTITRGNSCILCCACIKNCPQKARVVTVSHIKELAARLSNNFSERKEPEIFL